MKCQTFFDQLEDSKKLAYLDPLTQIPNRYFLDAYLAITKISPPSKCVGVFMVDIDYFKHVNDLFGHFTGDKILFHVAKVLQKLSVPNGIAIRIGGDEFLIIHEDLGFNIQAASALSQSFANQLLNALDQAFFIDKIEHQTQASIGFHTFRPGHHFSLDDLRMIDFSLYQAKKLGRHQAVSNPKEVSKLHLEQKSLNPKSPIYLSQYCLNFQAQFNNKQSRIGLEAYLRWQHPSAGLIPTYDFLNLILDQEHLIKFGEFILQEVFSAIQTIGNESRLSQLSVTMNMSPYYFLQPDFIVAFEKLLKTNRINLNLLTIEFSANDLPKNLKKIILKMQYLGSLGVKFCIDDMGLNEIALKDLINLPIHQMKLDALLNQNSSHYSLIVKSLVAISKTLNIPMCAKNIEDQENQENQEDQEDQENTKYFNYLKLLK